MAETGFRRLALVVAGAALIALGAMTYLYERDITQERERVANGGKLVNTPCGPIEYAVAGNGPPVLVVHGAGGGFDQGLDIGAPLIERGYQVIAMSRFGYLDTPLPADASPAPQADAHACLLDALGLKRVVVLGASAGAPSSLLLALRHPARVRALVLFVPATYMPMPGGGPAITPPSSATAALMNIGMRSDFLFWAMARLDRRLMFRAVLGTPPELVDAASADEQARIGQMLEHIQPISQRRLGLMNESIVVPTLPRYDLEHVRVPTLIISAADDLYHTYEPARYTAEHIRGARFVGFPSGGHMLVGRQRAVMEEIARFLKARDPHKR